VVRVYDLTTESSMVTLEGHKTEITGTSFSENGFYLATSATKDNIIKIWDLRKPSVFKSVELPPNYEVKNVRFDKSGSYLGIAGSTIKLFHVKSMSFIAEFNEHSDFVSDIKFGNNCNYFATTSLDRNMKIFDNNN
jgi:pre-mRNA-processing factor 19